MGKGAQFVWVILDWGNLWTSLIHQNHQWTVNSCIIIGQNLINSQTSFLFNCGKLHKSPLSFIILQIPYDFDFSPNLTCMFQGVLQSQEHGLLDVIKRKKKKEASQC